jgi:stage II sporulation protein E
MDACVLDLAGGYCSWGKIGAVPGYVMRSGRVELVRGESLPMGILNSITPSITDRVIRAGDVLLLVSDGIYDVMVDDCNDLIAQTLCDMKESLPSDISSAILKSAVKKCGGRARDDMTAIAIKIVAS